MHISEDHLLLFLLTLPSKFPTREDPSLDLQSDPNRRTVSGHTRGSGEKATEACHKLYISLKSFLFRSCATYILIHNMFILKNLKYYCKCLHFCPQSSGINWKCQENILCFFIKFMMLNSCLLPGIAHCTWRLRHYPLFLAKGRHPINLGN